MSVFENIENYSISLNYFVKQTTLNANKHGWKIEWNEKLPTYLMLIVTEISEAMEEFRDDNKEKFNVEIADVLIRLFHLCGDLGIPIEEVLKKKMLLNETRDYHHGRKRI